MTQLTNEQLLWVGVDFDNTIANNTGHPEYTPTRPLEGAREALRSITEQGLKVIVYTARAWSEYHIVESWMIEHDMPFSRIICGKPLFHWVIDDRNVEFTGDWTEALKKIGVKDGEV